MKLVALITHTAVIMAHDEGASLANLAEEAVSESPMPYHSNGDENKDIDFIERLAFDLSSYADVDISKQIAEVEQIVDGLLAKLEEFCTVIDLIRSESKDVLFVTLPVLHERCKDLQPIFRKIDQLEKFLAVVRACADDAEEKVKLAEKELGSKSIKKILQSVPVPKFLAQKKVLQPFLKVEVPSSSYVPPKTFKSADFLQSYETVQDSIVDEIDSND